MLLFITCYAAIVLKGLILAAFLGYFCTNSQVLIRNVEIFLPLPKQTYIS